MKQNMRRILGLALLFLTGTAGLAAETSPSAAPQRNLALTSLFADKTVARGSGVEIKQSQVDEAFTAYKASLAARGQTVPESQRAGILSNLVDRLVVEQLLIARATETEKNLAKERAEGQFGQYRPEMMSDEDFDRQLFAMGLNSDELRALLLKRTTCETVVERELGKNVQISAEEIRKFYDQNPQRFEEPEQVKVSHVLISTWDDITRREMSDSQKKARKAVAEKVLAKAKAGDDFTALVKEFSDDRRSKERNGEYTFPRRRLPPEFEAAAFSMKPDQISDIVTTRFGYHVIKFLQNIPPRKVPFEEVEKRLQDELRYREIQRLLPDYLQRLKQEAKIEWLHAP
jgi:peptidyl-prolyl cis-trans isomerase C